MIEPTLTPMMQQYRALKSQIPPDAVLLFRLGDFYELFFEDAVLGSQLLDLTLTQRQGIPMCGMPYGAAESYISRLITAGKRVALCDQTEVARAGQLVRREVTRIISPGSVLDSALLAPKNNNYCAGLLAGKEGFGVAFLDLSTGEFAAAQVTNLVELEELLGRYQPSELVMPQDSPPPALGLKLLMVHHDGWAFAPETAKFTLCDHLKTQSLDGFGLAGLSLATGAAGGLMHYLGHELRRDLAHVRRLITLSTQGILVVDPTTLKNLEIVESTRDSALNTTLLAAIDRTVTSGGGRLLRRWLLQPLRDLPLIVARQEAVRGFATQEASREELRSHLRLVRDLERLIARLSQGSGNARDLIALRDSVGALPQVIQSLQGLKSPPALARELTSEISPCPGLVDLLSRALVPEPPLTIKEGGMIQLGYRAELDELRSASGQGKEWLAQLQISEQERTGIKSLKVRYNSVFGYYIEITKSQLASVPADYTRKQTLANAERFITPQLKEMESKILGAEERARQMEYEIFQELRQTVLIETASLQTTARALHSVDILSGWGALMQEQRYILPELVDQSGMEVREGQHPVLAQLMLGEKFVPNDVHLEAETHRLIILTGPNMAGKSTYIRQVALLAILAQTGCGIPAKSARIGLVDRVFSRVGASDDLSRGQSTFMVEMNETANILHHATDRSLVILDEIGRGTSTFDGLSIAWAVAEHLHDQVGALTLFATHYHELTDLALSRAGVKNFSVAVREWNDQVIFLRKIVPGGADKSYGIQVARLAGLPLTVLDRAREILHNLEDNELDVHGRSKLASAPQKSTRAPRLKEVNTKSSEPPQEWDLFKPRKGA